MPEFKKKKKKKENSKEISVAIHFKKDRLYRSSPDMWLNIQTSKHKETGTVTKHANKQTQRNSKWQIRIKSYYNIISMACFQKEIMRHSKKAKYDPYIRK